MEKLKQTGIPQFICPGAAKSGTTTLFSILENHKDVYLFSGKEIGFFGREDRYRNGLDWYLKTYFSQYKEGQISGDISTNYMTYSKIVAKRIYDTLGADIKLIFMLRNPRDRAYSHYNMRRFNNLNEKEDFGSLVLKLNSKNRAFTEERTKQLSRSYGMLSKEEQYDWKMLNYFFLGNYSEVLKDYLKYFNEKNILIIKFEDFIADQAGEMEKVYSFIGVESPIREYVEYANPSGKIKHESLHRLIKSSVRILQKTRIMNSSSNNKAIKKIFYKYKNWNRKDNKVKPMKITDRHQLDNYYREDILKLEELTNIKFMDWINED